MATIEQPPEVNDADTIFPTRFYQLCPAWDQLTEDEKKGRGYLCEGLARLFFEGGTLESVGIKVRDGVDKARVLRFIRATLGDWSPSHEHKIGGIAHMLAKWCEPA